jgi:Tfp pilus assembly protein PilO
MPSVTEKKAFTSIIIFLVSALLIIGVVIVPTVRYILELDRQANELRNLLEKKNEQAVHYRSTLKQVEKIKDEAPNFSSYFFVAGDELKLVTTLEELAIHNAVTQRIDSSNIDNITDQRVLISLTVSGDYDKVLTYLSDLEHLPYFITVTRLNLFPIADKLNRAAQSKQVSMSLDVFLYVTKP